MNKQQKIVIVFAFLGWPTAQAAVSLDRTRVIYNEGEKSVSLSISNENPQLPYLAQGWIEDQQGNKITSPLTVLPPLQRVEPGEKSQIKVQALQGAALLARDRETLFYFNLREVPPRSDQPNTLQIALHTRVKLFYRPSSIVVERIDLVKPWQEKLVLIAEGANYRIQNPTAYYVTVVEASTRKEGPSIEGFEPVMIAPFSSEKMKGKINDLGKQPFITYIDDYGGRPVLSFSCRGDKCSLTGSGNKRD